jgi:anti-sigma B factor antagonist
MTDDAVLSDERTSFEVLADTRGDSVVLCVLGEMDIGNTHELTERFDTACSSRPSRIVFDIAGLTYADSSAIHALLKAAQRCDELDIEMRVVGAHGVVRRLFEIAEVSALLHLEPS